MMKAFSFLVTVLLLINGAHALEDFDKVQFKSQQVAPNLYRLEGRGGNITANIGKDGTLIVDSDFAELGEKLVAKLKSLGGNIPKYVINTHFHYDHTGGNVNFPEATIIASGKVKDRLSSEQVLWNTKHPPVVRGLPNLVYTDRLDLTFNGEEVSIVHYNHGHTDGDTVVFFPKSKVVSMGDLYFSGMYPIFHPEHGGSLSGYLKTIDDVISRIPEHTIIIPGHGPITQREELVNYRAMIKSSMDTVKRGMKNKWPLEKIVSKGLDQRWEKYSHGYRNTEKWLTSIFEACKKEGCQ